MNKQSPEYLGVREEIVRRLCEFNSRTDWTDKSWEDYKRYSTRFYKLKLQLADRILAIKGIAIISDNQDYVADDRWRSLHASIFTQQDMIKDKYMKVVK